MNGMRIGIDALYLQMPEYRAGLYSYTQRIIEQFLKLDVEDNFLLLLSRSNSLDRSLPESLVASRDNAACHISMLPQRLFPVMHKLNLPVHPFAGGKSDVYFGPAYRLFPGDCYSASVVTIHDLRFLFQPESFADQRAVRVFSHITRDSMARADILIAISAFTANQLINDCGIELERVRLIHNGVGDEFFYQVSIDEIDRIRDRYKILRPYVLFVGYIEEKKNLLRLVEAYSSVRQELDCDWELLLAGQKGEHAESLQMTIDKLGANNFIRMIGGIPDRDLPALYQGAELFVFPSLNEGFGLPPLEAMAGGIPVLASTAGALPEVLNGAALLVDPEDSSAIYTGLLKIISDKGFRVFLAEKGKEHARSFRWQVAAKKTLKVIQELATR